MYIYMDNYGYMRWSKTGKIYDWQVKCDYGKERSNRGH